MERRHFLIGATGAFLFGGNAFARPVPATGLELDDPAAAVRAMLRMQGRLDGADAPWWYFGRIYALLPGRAPIPLFRYEGTEIMRLTPTEDGEYAATGVTTTFFQDWKTKEWLETFRNPITGATNEVRPNLIGGAPGQVAAFYSVRGVRPGRVAKADWQPPGLELSWDFHGDTVWLSHDRSYPPGLPQPMGESSVAKAKIADLAAPDRAFVPASFSSTYFAPYPAWMEMKGQPGHVVWHADGIKLETMAQAPAHYRARIERLYPERVQAPPYRR